MALLPAQSKFEDHQELSWFKNNEMILISKTDLAQILNCLKLLTVKLSRKLQLAAALLQNLN